jgi:hypothetical protein
LLFGRGKSESIDSWNNTSSLEDVGEKLPAVRRRGELSWSADWNGGVGSIGRLGLTRLVDSSVGIAGGMMGKTRITELWRQLVYSIKTSGTVEEISMELYNNQLVGTLCPADNT